MPRTELSSKEMRSGIDAMLQRKSPLENFENPELDEAIGESLQEKVKEGFKWGVVIYPIFAPLFLSKSDNLEEARQQLIEDNGGEGKIEFYLVERTSEIFVLMK